jgi:hypothetical protein
MPLLLGVVVALLAAAALLLAVVALLAAVLASPWVAALPLPLSDVLGAPAPARRSRLSRCARHHATSASC